MRVLLIHQAFCGPDDPGGTRHYEFGSRLTAAGHEFTVITSPYNYLTGALKSSQRYSPEIEIHFSPTLSGLHRSYRRRIMVFLSFTVSSVIRALRLNPPDVVVGTSPPIFQAFSAWAVAAFRNRPFVLEVRDLWPEFAVGLGLLRNRFLISLARSLERFLYRGSQHIIVNSPAYLDHLVKRGISETKITLVSNGVDVSCFNPEDTGDEFRQEFQLEDKFVVMYAGAVGYANDVDCLLRAAARLHQHPGIAFMIVGDGKELPSLRQQAESRNLDNVQFVPAQPKHRMPKVLAAADVCVATLRDIPMFRTSYPNKVFDYMAAGRPTLLAIDGVIRNVIESSGGGEFVRPGDDCCLAEAILKMHHSPKLLKEMGKKARAYVAAHFDRDAQAREFAAVLQRVCNSQSTQKRDRLR